MDLWSSGRERGMSTELGQRHFFIARYGDFLYLFQRRIPFLIQKRDSLVSHSWQKPLSSARFIFGRINQPILLAWLRRRRERLIPHDGAFVLCTSASWPHYPVLSRAGGLLTGFVGLAHPIRADYNRWPLLLDFRADGWVQIDHPHIAAFGLDRLSTRQNPLPLDPSTPDLLHKRRRVSQLALPGVGGALPGTTS